MLGSCLYRSLRQNTQFETYGSYRTERNMSIFPVSEQPHLIHLETPNCLDTLEQLIREKNIDVVINCIGAIKQKNFDISEIEYIELNALLPHKLLSICQRQDTFLIHFSTDCVFNGKKGNYSESDQPNAIDCYGLTKYLGELITDDSLTIRTSIIGHEVNSSLSLIDWCLSQKGEIFGYCEAIFSGLPTIEISKVIIKILSEDAYLTGLFNLAATPIDKYTLLKKVVLQYKKTDLDVLPNTSFKIDRSLNAELFKKQARYEPPTWDILINDMYNDYVQQKQFFKEKSL